MSETGGRKIPGGFTGPVYFHLAPPGPPDRAVYQHAAVCLAEGLGELGIPYFSNRDYWRTGRGENDYLFRKDPRVGQEDCRVAVIDRCWFSSGGKFPPRLVRPGRRHLAVCLDLSDGHVTPSWRRDFSRFDCILRGHWNRNCYYPKNFRPWAFGLSRRIIAAAAPAGPFSARRRVLLANFRLPHPVRTMAEKVFYPRLAPVLPLDRTAEGWEEAPADPEARLFWEQTGRRHHPAYFRRLKESAASAAFSGFFLPSLPRLLRRPRGERLAARLGRRPDPESRRVSQWESWRFWETLAAGAAAVHLDFESYGLAPPVLPVNGVHYLGLSPENLDRTVRRLADDPGWLEGISAAGRDWALKHYGPRATAVRFLEAITGGTRP